MKTLLLEYIGKLDGCVSCSDVMFIQGQYGPTLIKEDDVLLIGTGCEVMCGTAERAIPREDQHGCRILLSGSCTFADEDLIYKVSFLGNTPDNYRRI